MREWAEQQIKRGDDEQIARKQAEAALADLRGKAEGLAEAAEYYVGGWNNYDGHYSRLKQALAAFREQGGG